MENQYVGKVYRLSEDTSWNMNGGGKKTGRKTFRKGHLFRVESMHKKYITSVISSLIDPEEKIHVMVALSEQAEDHGLYWNNLKEL